MCCISLQSVFKSHARLSTYTQQLIRLITLVYAVRDQETLTNETLRNPAQDGQDTEQGDNQCSEPNQSISSVTSPQDKMESCPAMEQYVTERDEHQAFLVTGQHDEAAYAQSKANELKEWEQNWKQAKEEGTNGVHV